MRNCQKFIVFASLSGVSAYACKTLEGPDDHLMSSETSQRIDVTQGYQRMGKNMPQPFSYFCGDSGHGECNGGGSLWVSTEDQTENGVVYKAGEAFLALYSHRGKDDAKKECKDNKCWMKGRAELGMALPFDGRKPATFEYSLVAKLSSNVGTFIQVQPMCGLWTPYLMLSGSKDTISLSIFPSSKDAQHKVVCTANLGSAAYLNEIHSYKLSGLLANNDAGYWDLFIDGKLITTNCSSEHSYQGDTVANDICDAGRDKKVQKGREVQLKIGTYEGWYNPNPSEAWAVFYSQEQPRIFEKGP